MRRKIAIKYKNINLLSLIVMFSQFLSLSLSLQDFHHDVTLKQVLVLYLNSVKTHECVLEKEVELAEELLKYVCHHGNHYLYYV